MRSIIRCLLLLCASLVWTVATAAERAPDFLIYGRNVDEPAMLSEYRGKVVYIDFWASWCAPCRQSFPWMNELHQRYSDRGLVVVAVNLDESRADANRFLRQIPARFPIVFHPEGNLPEKYGVQAMPTSYLVDREGRIVHRELGFELGETERVEGMIARLLRSPD